MAGENGPETSSLIQDLRQRAVDLDFFHAVRRLEAVYRDRTPLGKTIKASEDVIRFCQHPSLRFEPSSISEYREGADGIPARLFVAFLGLLGPNGPMPLHMTEFVRDRERNSQDHAMARFLDMFNHRMICLFYRAWAANQQTASFDRPEADRFAVFIGSLLGIGMPGMQNRDEVSDISKLHYSGHLSCQARHADGLRSVLEDYFRVPVRIEQFIGQWLELPEDCQCRVGESPRTGTMGKTIIVGRRTWECQQRFRIRMGPMRFADYQRLLPGGGSLHRLVDWVRNYAGDQLGFDVQLALLARETPGLKLGKVGQLGWSTWLTTRTPEKDVEDLVLRCA